MGTLAKSILAYFDARLALKREERAEKKAINAQFRSMVADQWAKRQQYKALVGSEMSYPILQDMINAVSRSGTPVEVTFTLKDGTPFKISPVMVKDRSELDSLYKEYF